MLSLKADLRLLDGLERIMPWLDLPGDSRPSAGALAMRIEVETGKPAPYRRLAWLLASAGLTARRKAGGYGYDRAELLNALRPGGVLADLKELLAAQESRPAPEV